MHETGAGILSHMFTGEQRHVEDHIHCPQRMAQRLSFASSSTLHVAQPVAKLSTRAAVYISLPARRQ